MCSGVNPVDTYIRSGNYGALPQLPYVPGKDGSGIVKLVGSGVTMFKVNYPTFINFSSNFSFSTIIEFFFSSLE